MDQNKLEMTFDDLPNVAEVPDTEGPSVMGEIDRTRKLYLDRMILRRKRAADIQPLYYDHMQRRDRVAKYPVYKFFYVPPKPIRNYGNCEHIGQIIIDRDILTKDEHINILAQPKPCLGGFVKPPRYMYQKRFLPNCTTRVDSLAHPKSVRVQQNWHEFRHVLSVRQASNLRKNIHKPPIDYTTIENAITYVHEERRLKGVKKNETLKKCSEIRKKILKTEKQCMRKIIFALYEVMKDFLVSDQFVTESSNISNLCRVIESKIIQFYGLENHSTSHVQHLLKTVAQNLAIWIENFTSNCGFKNPRSEKEMEEMRSVGKQMDESELLLPVDDYIPYRSPSMSIDQESFQEGDVYEDEDDYTDAHN